MELKFKPPGYIIWNEAASCKEDNVNGKDESIPIRNEYPQPPVPDFEFNEGYYDKKKFKEFMVQRSVSIAKSRANDIIIPDPTPQRVSDAIFDNYDKLKPILKKYSVWRFLRLFKDCLGRGMSWDLSITSEILTLMVSYNALRCAKLVLEGKAPELYGMHGNPNCINPCGYFPLHEAAERFCCDMIKLLLRHGASANVRTVGNDVIENLLPLHVAIENICMHKYLEDNLSPSQSHLEYIYKLTHLLCLPEMIYGDDIVEVLEDVFSILKEYGFNPTGETMETIELRPYDCKMSDRESCSKGCDNDEGSRQREQCYEPGVL